MDATDDSVIEEIVHEGSAMTLTDLFTLIERSHDEQAGIDREAVVAYVRELESRADYAFDGEQWVGPDRFYELDDARLSQYPKQWHDRLGGERDAAAYVRFIREEAPEFVEDTGQSGAGEGIPEDTLIKVMSVVGRLETERARAAVEDGRERGNLAEDVDQHPQAGVFLTEEGGER